MRMIVFLDAVGFTRDLKAYGRDAISPKINRLREFAEFFFVFKLGGQFIGNLGDGFLILCPPAPPEVLSEALACQSFIDAYNVGKAEPLLLNVRIAIHYGLISPPEGGNYVDTNLNLTARLEGATPPNSICISGTLHDIVADTLKDWRFRELRSAFKGLGENRYYLIEISAERGAAQTRRESRLSFYMSTLSSLGNAGDWQAVRNTCEQALLDLPGNPLFISQLGFALVRLDEFPAAIRQFEQCVERGYEAGTSLLWISRAHEAMGNISRSIEILREIVEKYPDVFHAPDDLASIYFERRDLDEASRWAKRSLKINPRFIYPMATLLAIHLVRREHNAGVLLISKLATERRTLLRQFATTQISKLSKAGFKTRLEAMFRDAGGRTRRVLKPSGPRPTRAPTRSLK